MNQDIIQNISNAFVGSISDMYKHKNENDQVLYVLMKENRYMYLALLFIFLLLIFNVFFYKEETRIIAAAPQEIILKTISDVPNILEM